MTHFEFYKSGFEGVAEKTGIRVGGIVHVGAHEGEEVELYEKIGFSPIVLVEADPYLSANLESEFGDRVEVVSAAAGPRYSEAELHVVDRDRQLSSMMTPSRPCDAYHSVKVPVRPLLSMIGPDVNVAVIDVQGSELDVLRGAPMDQLDLIVLEVGTKRWYDEQPMRWQVEKYMVDIGWRPVNVYAHGARAIWFDIAYVRSGK